ncbi:MAG: DUF5615 family PIN-like protein [Rhizobacter sp.]|nr:DUF5615 family PIN-like protein [Rhizobacter sp.]
MRVLIDECLPRQLKQWLVAVEPDWFVRTVQEAGWASMKNGMLLRAANEGFEVLLTADKNMHHQQNLAGLTISVLVFPANLAKTVRKGVPAIVQSIPRVGQGKKALMDIAAGSGWDTAKLADLVVEDTIVRHVFRQ